MFYLRVHTLDLSILDAGSSEKTPNPRIEKTKGVIHLYRSVDHQPSFQSPQTTLFVVAVPTRFSDDDFLRFYLPFLSSMSFVRFIRNDGIFDRYSVLLSFDDWDSANGFYSNFNGQPFFSFEAEVCHLLFVIDVEYTEFADIAGTPPLGLIELPTCPVCLERLDQDTGGIVSTCCDHSFHCSCISKWKDSSCQVCKFCMQHSEKLTCSICQTSEDVWICLICGFVGCGRYKEGHAIRHWEHTQHCYSLDLQVQMVWDYVGDHFVHRLDQSNSDGKLAKLKYGCQSIDNVCCNCECQDHSILSGALYKSKVDAVVDEYTQLLVSQLESQRQIYEALLKEAITGRENLISDAVEKTLCSKMQDIEIEIERSMEDKKKLEEVNRDLTKNQDCWRKKLKEVQERERAAIDVKNEKILDLKEQASIMLFEIQETVILLLAELNNSVDGRLEILPSI